MNTRSIPSFLYRTLCAAALACLVGVVHAERADRNKPLNVAADSQGSLDLLKQVVVFTGNVVITKGTIVIQANRVEVRETPDGYRLAIAFGTADRPATFRQKRDGVDEYIDGQAERLEYDDKADTVRFVNHATVRRLRGNQPADEVTGRVITYDNTSEVFNVAGGNPGTVAANDAGSAPTGRVRAVLTPREGTAAASEAASATAPLPLQSTRSLSSKP